jgi:arylsulfatase A-like enzyme
VKADQPFCFWFGGQDPHRPYEKGSGVAAGLKPERVKVPAWLPDTPEVRSDICDYLLEVQRFDRLVGEMVALLEQTGRLENTLVVMTSDNGMPFPRGKANLYDSGTRMPLAVRWGAKVKGGRAVDDFVSHTDLAPTILEAAGVKPEQPMAGRSFLNLLAGGGAAGEGGGGGVAGEAAGSRDTARDKVFVERERHANVRAGDLGYPARAVITKQFAYVRNFRPERWPAGDPEKWVAVGPFGDIDGGPAKDVVTAGKADPMIAAFFALACEKRPAEELYDLAKDPEQVKNVAADPAYAEAKRKLAADLDAWMAGTNDPRASTPETDGFDKYPYFGAPARKDGRD